MTEMSEDMVQRVAQLARLNLSDEERRFYQKQLASIIGYVERLSELDERLAQIQNPDESPVHPEREDEMLADFNLEAALENAPKKVGTAFQVPKIIE
ncbi:MAG: Asp-tRNA(Asn)/Glu-tRNA(Gln) amidotransferase subunit GatC [Oligoflexus sp.]